MCIELPFLHSKRTRPVLWCTAKANASSVPVDKPVLPGMQIHPFRLFSCIQRITQYGKSDRGQMRPDLMRTARMQLQRKKTQRPGKKHRKFRMRGASVFIRYIAKTVRFLLQRRHNMHMPPRIRAPPTRARYPFSIVPSAICFWHFACIKRCLAIKQSPMYPGQPVDKPDLPFRSRLIKIALHAIGQRPFVPCTGSIGEPPPYPQPANAHPHTVCAAQTAPPHIHCSSGMRTTSFPQGCGVRPIACPSAYRVLHDRLPSAVSHKPSPANKTSGFTGRSSGFQADFPRRSGINQIRPFHVILLALRRIV